MTGQSGTIDKNKKSESENIDDVTRIGVVEIQAEIFLKNKKFFSLSHDRYTMSKYCGLSQIQKNQAESDFQFLMSESLLYDPAPTNALYMFEW